MINLKIKFESSIEISSYDQESFNFAILKFLSPEIHNLNISSNNTKA